MAMATSNLLSLLGRMLFSFIFLFAGIMKIMNFNQTVAQMTQEGIPYAEIFIIGALLVELLAGLMILFGWKARFGALLIALFILLVTFVFHDYWTYSGTQMGNQLQHFLKNMALLGGAFYIMAFGPGGYSVDAKHKALLGRKKEVR